MDKEFNKEAERLIDKMLDESGLSPKPTVDKEAIDMTAQEWFEKGSMFTLDFLLPEERETIYKIMDLYALGKIKFHSTELLKENEELKESVRLLHESMVGAEKRGYDKATAENEHLRQRLEEYERPHGKWV